MKITADQFVTRICGDSTPCFSHQATHKISLLLLLRISMKASFKTFHLYFFVISKVELFTS